MEVRCERCKTEYEFDDSRVTEAGVAVQCTTCGHVFKVKKKAVWVTLPLQPGDMAGVITPSSDFPPLSTAERHRGWRVRQPNGKLFTFRELTSLQKWIIEQKVGRDDEISLTGTEHWKRLGNIAELNPFFKVVEEAQKSVQHEAQGTAGEQDASAPGPIAILTTPLVYPPVSPSSTEAPSVPPDAAVTLPPSAGFPDPDAQPTAQDRTPSVIVEGLDLPPGSEYPIPPGNETIRVRPDPPAFARASAMDGFSFDEATDEDYTAVKKGGAGRWVFLLLVLGGLAAGGYYGYVSYWLPQQQKEEAATRESARAEQAQLERDRAAAQARARALEEARAKAAREARSEEQARLAENPSRADAGTSAQQTRDAGSLAVVKREPSPAPVTRVSRSEPPRNFDFFMTQGNRYLEKQRPLLALEYYGKAADIRPDRAEPFAGRGLSLLDMGDLNQAEASFQEALKLNPSYGVAVIGLAKTYLAQGQKEKAVEYYGKYLEILPDGPEANGAKLALKRLKQE